MTAFLVAVIIFVRIYFASSSWAIFFTFPHYDGNTCAGESLHLQQNGVSIFTCLTSCHRDTTQQCVGVFYKESNRQCFRCSNIRNGSLEAMDGTRTYMQACKEYLVPSVNDSQLTESSVHLLTNYEAYSGKYARLDTIEGAVGTGSWSPTLSDHDPYVQVDFLELQYVVGVVTQGRYMSVQWVTQYQVRYSTDCINWEYVVDQDGNKRNFPGNFDGETYVTNMFQHPVIARCVRLTPTEYVHYPSMRFDVLGCRY